MATSLDLITDAMLMAGVAGAEQPLDAATAQIGLRTLNRIMNTWSNENLMVFDIVEGNFALTPGTAGYSTALLPIRPIQIDYIFIRQNAGNTSVDYPMELIGADEYAELTVKGVTSLPAKAYFNNSFPVGTIYFYPVPSAAYQAYVGYYDVLQTFADLTTVAVLPPGYEHALVCSLARELSPYFGKQASPEIHAAAHKTRNVLKRQNYRSPIMETNTPLGEGLFNVYRGS